MLSKRWLWFGIVLLAVLLTGWIVIKIATKSTVAIKIMPEVAFTKISVSVDGQPLSLTDSQNRIYRGRVGAGKHTVRVTIAGYEDFATDFNTQIRTSVNIEANPSEITAEGTARAIYPTSKDTVISNARFFADTTWLVFTTSSTTNSHNGSIVVAQYSAGDAHWVVVADGTDISFSASSLVDAPSGLKSYVREIL